MNKDLHFSFIGGKAIILERAIDVFEKIINKNHSVHFLNLYNGVKVECFGKVLSIENEYVVCEVNLMQILAMKEERNAYIVQDEYFAKNIVADIVSVDIANSTVTLKNFTYANNLHANLRKFQRVYPNRYTKVILSDENGEIQGNLYDISEGGIGVISTNCGTFRSGGVIKAKFVLEIPATKEIKDIEVDLKLIVELVYRGAVRYCCQIIEGQDIQETINQFTKERVKDTVKELKEQLSLYQ
ncbi:MULTISPECIES: PilZ domain-containing protein [unclassified Campylobacter]|uniref:PilZ domain-containing protein n=1 Tax=unclassified Campylobacter TaxID=2593542 RepID=UPI001474E4B6|nr:MULTISPECIES: PilZ domain-containing protein [unclassified Campylobacter]QKG28591.1 PilZ domain-containing protein [Campylobacter sp. RM16187]